MSRIVMFVLNPCRTDVRVLREAGALVAAGHGVTIMARTDAPYARTTERETRDGVEIVRVPVASGITRWLLLLRARTGLRRELSDWTRAAARDPAAWLRGASAILLLPFLVVAAAAILAVMVLGRAVPPVGRALALVTWTIQWRVSVLGWAARTASAAPRATMYHAHDLPALPAALEARDRAGGLVVYDSHEVFVESGRNARRPATVRRAMRAMESRLAARTSALVTVNDALGERLGGELGVQWIVVVRNCPPRWTPPDPPERRFHAALGLPDTARIVLYHGGFVPERGIEQLLAALPALPADAVVVLLGYGPLRDGLVAQARSTGLSGRVHVLDAVPPTELPAWVASADVGIVAIQPTTLNHRLSTPNKLFETLGAGVPVVASDFPAMRAIVLDDPDGPLGAVCDPTDPAAIAAAIGEILARPPAEAADLRARCLRAAHARYSWETQLGGLLDVYQGLTGDPW